MLKNIVVIVESPAKCKKIESFLGPGYKVIASFGHVRELGTLKNINIENNFEPTYQLIEDPRKKTHIESMRKDIEAASEVLLATDDDREGEAIAWHICMLFGLSVESTKRIVFHEITESAILNAVRSPTLLNMDTVYSQQARQILDLLVGFTITPLLWKYISKNSENSLSAGRCQTPALKLIYENQKEIDAHPGKKVFDTTGYFTNHCIPFELKKQYEKEDDMLTFLEESVSFDHVFECSKPKKVYKTQPEPLTTSRIQQIVSNELHLSPKDTMKICQTLYEEGYITYMRTDSKKYSSDFIESVKKWIVIEFHNPLYIHTDIDFLSLSNEEKREINENPPKIKKESNTKKDTSKDKKDTLEQGAHEAIRPTNIFIKNVDDKNLDLKEKKVYKIIWKIALESCMSPAEYFSITSKITAPLDTHYTYSEEKVDFLGWKAVAKDKEKESNYYDYLQKIKPGFIISYKKITCKMTIAEKKLHYTEAKLVQLLEENGIGRPSTFSMLTDKIQDRGYVKKEDIKGTSVECTDYELEDDTISEINTKREFGNERAKLVLQPLGQMVMEFLDKHFNSLFNYEYTRSMEDDLDKISKGEAVWTDLCRTCLNEMSELCELLKTEKKQEYAIDDHHTYMIGKFGPVIKSTNEDGSIGFKSVRDDLDLNKLKRGEYTIDDILLTKTMTEHVLGKFQGHDLILKKGKFGLYVTYNDNKKSLSCFGNRPIENIKYQDVLEILMKDVENTNTTKNVANIVRKINDSMSIRNGKYGDYIFYKTAKMKNPTFHKLQGFTGDYKNGNIDLLKKWINETYKIRI